MCRSALDGCSCLPACLPPCPCLWGPCWSFSPAPARPYTSAPAPPCLLRCRARELFDWIRALEGGHPLQSLLDVYSYTAMISLCITEHDVDRALKVLTGR